MNGPSHNKPEFNKPGEAGQKEYQPDGHQVLQALLSQVFGQLDAQKGDNKPADPRIQELMVSIISEQNSHSYKDKLSVADAIKGVWQRMPQPYQAVGPLADPFFQPTERFLADLQFYTDADPAQAARDLAQEWMDTYQDNKTIEDAAKADHPGAAAAAGSDGPDRAQAESRVQQLLGDHDLDISDHPESMTAEEYAAAQKVEVDQKRRQMIREGRTALPPSMADLAPEAMRNVERRVRQEQAREQKAKSDRLREAFKDWEKRDAAEREQARAEYNAREIAESVARGKERDRVRKEAKKMKH